MYRIAQRITTLISLLVVMAISCQSDIDQKTAIDFNFDWEFALQDSLDLDQRQTDNLQWKTIHLPHDWSVESSFDSITGEGATGYLPGGIGWYKKQFQHYKNPDELTFVLFDGVYNNADFWINGNKLGFHPYGYSPFYFNITPYLNEDGNNVLMVKVDRSRYADSRWYSGSGIYRKVELITTNKLHIPIWGTFITTPKVTKELAQIMVEVQVKNEYLEENSYKLRHEIFAPNGTLVQTVEQAETLQANASNVIQQEILIDQPALWDINQPNLYTVVSSLLKDEDLIHQYETNFGIRSIRFDAENGFFLNGNPTKIKGVCLHHDAGLVGAAVPKGVWKRRLQKLREAGCNAIRISHNPGSEEFLQLCDEMGFLVQDEFFDEWDNPKDKRLNMNERKVDYITRGYTKHFQEWAERDLKNTMLAHRNHPSIIQWSIGNEIEWTYPRNAAATGFFDANWSGNYFWSQPPFEPKEIKKRYQESTANKYQIEKTAQKLATWTRSLDTTRPVIANCILPSASLESGYTDVLDIVGFSYRRVMYDYARKYYPQKTVMGTENLGQWHEWKAVQERPFISGTFLWTGIDYLGEANEGWPRKGTPSGLLDLAGFEKPSYYMMKSLWSERPTLYISTQTIEKSIYRVDEQSGVVIEKQPGAWQKALWVWHEVNNHWNYKDGDTVIVEIISNYPQVELFLNDQSLGVKQLSNFEDRIYKWAVPFTPGILQAKGKQKRQETATQLITALAPSAIQLTVDKNLMSADGYDVAHIIAQLVDAKGNPVRTDDRKLDFSVVGPAKILGVDNGAIDNVQPFQSNTLKTSQGRGLLLIQSNQTPGAVSIRVESKNLESTVIEINIQ